MRIALALSFILFLSACQTVGTMVDRHSQSLSLLIRYAVARTVYDSENPYNKAQQYIAAAKRYRPLVESGVIVSLVEISEFISRDPDLANLHPADQMLIEELIESVRISIHAKIKGIEPELEKVKLDEQVYLLAAIDQIIMAASKVKPQ